MTTTEQTTLFDRLGADPAVHAAVAGMSRRILADSELAPYYAPRLATPVDSVVGTKTGGPPTWRGRGMLAPPAHPQDTDSRFDRVAGHLAAELNALDVEPATADELLAVVGSLRDYMVVAS